MPTKDIIKAELDARIDKLGGLVNALREHTVSAKPVKSQHQLGWIMQEVAFTEYKNRRIFLPDEAAKALGDDVLKTLTGRVDHVPSLQFHLMYPRTPGQMSNSENVLIVIEPYWYGDDNKYVLVEVGCTHEYVETQLGRCWRRATCVKCGAYYEVDSSD